MNIKTAIANAAFILDKQGFNDNSISEFTIMIELPDGRTLYVGLDESETEFRFEVSNRTTYKAFEMDKPL